MSTSMYSRNVSYGPIAATSDNLVQLHSLIERRAYERWASKGCPDGTALQDWLEAEAEVNAELELERLSPPF